MAYDRYVTEFNDNENRTYGVMDAEAREEVSNVKSAFESIDSALSTYITKVEGKNRFNPDTITEGKVINESGQESSMSGKAVTDFIAAEVGKKVTYSVKRIDPGDRYKANPTYVTFYNSNKECISGGAFNTNDLEMTEGCAYIRVSFNVISNYTEDQIEFTTNGTNTAYEAYHVPTVEVIQDFVTEETAELLSELATAPEDISYLQTDMESKLTEPETEGTAGQALVTDGNGGRSWESITINVDKTLTQQGEAADAKATGDAIRNINGIIEEYVDDSISRNFYNPLTITSNKVIDQNGTENTMNNREVTDFINAEVGKKATISRKNISSGIQELKNPVFVTCYDSGKIVMSGGAFNTNNLTIPEGCAYIRVSLETDANYAYQIEFTSNGEYTPYEAYHDPEAVCVKDFVTQETSSLINNNVKPSEVVGHATSGHDYWHANHTAKMVELTSDISTSLSVHGITVWDLDHPGSFELENIEEVSGYTGAGKKYKITTSAASVNSYRAVGSISGLTVGRTYRVCLKITDSQNDSAGGGHYCQVFIANSLQSIGNVKRNIERVFTATFTASYTSYSVYIQPFMTNNATTYSPAVGDEFTIDDLYINEVNANCDLLTHEKVFSNSATGTKLLANVDGGMFIASASAATVKIIRRQSNIITINGMSPENDGDITIKSHLQGKTVVFFGDSVVNKGAMEFTDSVRVAGQITGMNAINAAIGGSALHWRNNANWDIVGFVNMVNMIVSGDWSDMEELAEDTSFEMHERLVHLLPIITAIDWDDVDFICINYGGNDISTDANYSKIDNENNPYDTSTYLGAFRYAIEMLTTEYPQIKVLVTSAVFRWWNVDGVKIDSDVREMADGHLYYEWGDALIKCAEKEYHYPTLDVYRMLGANKTNYLYYSDDGAHPNQPFIDRMGSLFGAAFMSKF